MRPSCEDLHRYNVDINLKNLLTIGNEGHFRILSADGKTYGPLEEARILCLARGAKDHIAPSHISKMVPPTVHSGP